MYKFILVVCLFLLLPLHLYAQIYNNEKKYSGNVYTSMTYNMKMPNPYGKEKEDTVNTIGINFTYNFFNFNGYIDIHDIFFLFDDRKFVFGNINNYLYGEINPRISLVWLAKKKIDKSFIFKDFLIAYDFTFDSKDLLQHYIGIGVDFNIPLFSYFKTNLYARYNQAYYGRNEDSFDGFMLNVAYEVPIYAFKNGIEIVYSSWLKYIFATSPNNNIANETNYSIKWNNTFKLGYKFIYVGYTYEHNQNFLELNSHSSNSGEHSFGIYYTYKF